MANIIKTIAVLLIKEIVKNPIHKMIHDTDVIYVHDTIYFQEF